MFDSIKQKHVPEDFIVRESVAVRFSPEEIATHHLLLLRKRGFTTMEAVGRIADALDITTGEVGYCGLKDEDGVTEQVIAVPRETDLVLPPTGLPLHGDQERWLTLVHYGFAATSLGIGTMEGNSFKVVLRNLDADQSKRLTARKKVNLLSLNYFDTQRFGVPGGPKKSHLVGTAMLADRWDDARSLLSELQSPESVLAADWQGDSRDLFLSLDPRTASFFLAAHASYEWNTALRELVSAHCPERLTVQVDGMSFGYVPSTKAAAQVMAAAHELPSVRYTFDGGAVRTRMSTRATVVATTVEVGPPSDDEHFPGMCKVELSLFLPSGSYATSAVRQLLLQLQVLGSAEY